MRVVPAERRNRKVKVREFIKCGDGRRGRLATALLIAVTYCTNGVGSDLGSNLKACVEEHDDSRRLACFDRAMATPVPAPAGEHQQPQQTTTIFGLSEAQQHSEAKPRKLTDRVTSVTRRADGGILVTLANGQVWKTLDPEYFPVKEGDSVTIYAGALGGFWLSFTSGSKLTVHVKRITGS